MRRFLALMLLMAAFFPANARAHPHVWVGTAFSFVVAKGTVTGLRVEWAFDDFFSSSLLADFDVNKNGRFEAEEVKVIEKKAFAKTGEQNWFTYIKLGDKTLKGLVPKEFSVDIRKKEVVYSFLLPLPEPVDPRKTPISVSYFEESYYIEMLPPKKDPVRFEGDGSLSCSAKADEDKSVKFYFNSVSPMRVTLKC
ncbi:MAG: DUF1007 family protein [Rhodospirillales bacterium]|jgi:tRNA threonylcarbamoyladenosine biosynthesis protein TsaE|nr:DUF1007 family protein [Rhodospirillales bacterium]